MVNLNDILSEMTLSVPVNIKYLTVVASPVLFRPALLVVDEGIAFNRNILTTPAPLAIYGLCLCD